MIKLGVVICSTRPGRQGASVAKWAFEHARVHAAFESELVDLATFELPLLDEPEHPRLQKYTKDHTRAWSAKVASLDAFVFVSPEYDFSMCAALLNALQFLFVEWKDKACAFVSYGGVSGGLRGVQMAKQVVTSLSMMPIAEGVSNPFFAKQVVDGVYAPNESQDRSALTMLDSLAKWSRALKPMRG